MAKRSTRHPTIQIKRIYDPPSDQDGVRVLVDRIWPRGIAKSSARLDDWAKDLAPTAALRKWFGHDPDRWKEFQHRYYRELEAQPERIAAMLDLARGRTLTLLYGARDVDHNNALALKNYLAR